jgi:hypothetical protein
MIARGGKSETANQLRNLSMNDKKPIYRVEIKYSGTPQNKTYGWEIYRNLDVLPILRSQQHFGSRMAGLADANRSRLQLSGTDFQNRTTKNTD